MNRRHLQAALVALSGWILVAATMATDRPVDSQLKGEIGMERAVAKGSFDVEVTAQEAREGQGRMFLDKRYNGDLEGTAEGTMVTWRGEGGLPAAYVAIERVTGTLDGRSGSFVLTHRGTMTGDEQRLSIRVVPGSGTDGLAGLSGTMGITIDEGAHHYELEYELGDAPSGR